MDFLELFNAVARKAKPMHMDLAFATSMDDEMADLSIDSLDGLMMMMYIGELFGIDDEVAKDFNPKTVQEVYDFVQQHKTKEPTSMEEVREVIK